jgi:hypothetical protein
MLNGEGVGLSLDFAEPVGVIRDREFLNHPRDY